jgi:dCTP deaminase
MGVLSDRQIEAEVKIEPFDPGTRKPGTISSGLTSYGYDMRLGYKFGVFSPVHATEVDPKNFDPRSLVTVDLSPACHAFEKTKNLTMRDPVTFTCAGCLLTLEKMEAVKAEHRPCPARQDEVDPFLRIPPHSFVLAESLERFKVPRDTLGVVVGKSTYARCGLIVNCTPMEPEWEGVLTIELSNTTPLPLRVYPGEGIAQVFFIRSDERSEVVYDSTLRHFAEQGCTDEYSNLVNNKFEASCRVSYADRKGKYNNQAGLTLPIAQPDDTDAPAS